MPWCWNSLQEGAWKRHRFELDVGQNRNYVLLTVKEDKMGRMQTVPSHSTTNQINKPKLKSYSTRGFNLCATHILAAISPATLHNLLGNIYSEYSEVHLADRSNGVSVLPTPGLVQTQITVWQQAWATQGFTRTCPLS